MFAADVERWVESAISTVLNEQIAVHCTYSVCRFDFIDLIIYPIV